MFRVTLEELNDAGIVVESVSKTTILAAEGIDEPEYALAHAFTHCLQNIRPGVLEIEKLVCELLYYMRRSTLYQFDDCLLSEMIEQEWMIQQSAPDDIKKIFPNVYEREHWVYTKKQSDRPQG